MQGVLINLEEIVKESVFPTVLQKMVQKIAFFH